MMVYFHALVVLRKEKSSECDCGTIFQALDGQEPTLVINIIRSETSIAEASRSFDFPLLEIQDWVEEGKRGMEKALRAKALNVKEQYEQQMKEL